MRRAALALAAGVVLAGALACSLTEAPTPTFLPPATFTVPPPIEPATPLPTGEANPTLTLADAGLPAFFEQIDHDRLLIGVRTLQDFGTRYVLASPNSRAEGIGGAREWIVDRFERIAETARANGISFVTLPHTFALDYRGSTTTQTNVLAYLSGAGGRVNQVIVVGAHYDSISEYADATSPAPGADDNASGVAVMLECARLLAQTPAQERATVIFAAFSGEEVGMVGSRAFLEDVVQGDNLDMRAMINLDMVGAQALPSGEVIADRARVFSAPPNDSDSRRLARLAAFVAARYVPGFTLEVQPTVDREGRWGDHMSFSDAGYPAVRLIEAAETPDRANSTRDTIEHVSAGYMARITQATLAVLRVLAEGPAPPSEVAVEGSPPVLTWTPPPQAAGYILALRRAESLGYDRWLRIDAANRLELRGEDFVGMAYLTMAALDAEGRQGPFGAETPLP